MGFEKGNAYGKGRVKGSKNKKTIAKESISKLNEIGISPVTISNEIIESLLNNEELSIKEQILLLQTTSSLFKYEILTKSEKLKMELLLKENIDLKEEVKELTNFIGTPLELLNKIKEDKHNEE